jgi:hypothetical protein
MKMSEQISNERQRIDNLLANGRIGAEDHQILVDALVRKSSATVKFFSVVANPFHRLSSLTGVVCGLTFIGLLSFLGSHAGLHFPGTLDLQIINEGRRQVSIGELFVENLIDTLFLALIFYLGALIYRRRNLRIVDFVSTNIFSRLPYTVFALIAFATISFFPDLVPVKASQQPSVEMMLLAASAIIFLTWNMVLIFSGLKESSGLKGRALWTTYIVGIIMAEAISYSINFVLFK